MKTTNNIIRKLTAVFLTLVIAVGLLPAPALAAEKNLPDWYFLFAIFKNVDADYSDVNGDSGHTVYTMTQDEIDMLRINARELEEFLSQVGVIRPHVDVVEIDTPITELKYSNVGSYLEPEQAAPLLADAKVDLNQYDHVFCIASLNVDMSAYTGATGAPFENGTGQSFINTVNLKYWTYTVTHRNPVKLFNHEFLHFMEQMSSRWGSDFRLHLIGDKFYANDTGTADQTDIMLNRVKGDAESGTGIAPVVWQYPPHVLRTISDLTIPDGVTGIGQYAFYHSGLESVTIPSSVTNIEGNAFCGCANLKSVRIPNSITSIKGSTFNGCSSLKSVTIPSSVTSIGVWAFTNCSSLESVSIPAGVTSIGETAFYGCNNLKDVHYGGTEEQWKAITIGDNNSLLKNATIHCNSTLAEVTDLSEDGRTVVMVTYPANRFAGCQIFAASYQENSRPSRIVRGTWNEETSKIDFSSPVPKGSRLFFLDGNFAPVHASLQIPA